MAKRFTATEIWKEDWFLDMPIEYKLFWYYMLSNCDHSGIYKVNLRSFCSLNEVKLDTNQALILFNTEKIRIRCISDTIWFIEDFFVYQYGYKFNINNRVHYSIKEIYEKYGIDLEKIRGLKEVNYTVKDKDKDKDINTTSISDNRLSLNSEKNNLKNKNEKNDIAFGNNKLSGTALLAQSIKPRRPITDFIGEIDMEGKVIRG